MEEKEVRKSCVSVKCFDVECGIKTISLNELQLHIKRCERLLQHKSLFDRLPDKGARIKDRYRSFLEEQERRKGCSNCEDGNDKKRVMELTNSNDISQNDTFEYKHDVCKDKEADSISSTIQNEVEKMKIIEKYKDYKVPVEETVRRCFGSTLNEKEINRILNSVPANYFLTYRETCERARDAIEQLRENELQTLISNVKIL